MTTPLPSKERLAEIHKLAAKSDKYIYHLRADEVEAMARALLAAHEQEPVATLDVQSGRTDGKKFALVYSLAAHQLPDDVYFLHIHPAPVPAVPDEMEDNGNPHDEEDMAYVGGWNACRAAMLNGGKS